MRTKLFTLLALGLVLAVTALGAIWAVRPSAPAVAAVPQAPSLTAPDAALTTAAANAGPSVVKIESSRGLGSVVIIDTRGYIVTNFHVLFGTNASNEAASRYMVTLPSGAAHAATIAGTDFADDLAVLKISASGLHALALADSGSLRVGQVVLAVGNPLGYAQSMTLSIVSTLGRNIVENGPAAVIFQMIQTSAPINPGNSGGALVDLHGHLAGIPTLAATDPRLGTAAQGIGFAIPSNRVAFIARQIMTSGKVVHSRIPYLGLAGLQVVTPQLAAMDGLRVETGLLVGEVAPGGPAEKAGLHAGEVILRLGG